MAPRLDSRFVAGAQSSHSDQVAQDALARELRSRARTRDPDLPTGSASAITQFIVPSIPTSGSRCSMTSGSPGHARALPPLAESPATSTHATQPPTASASSSRLRQVRDTPRRSTSSRSSRATEDEPGEDHRLRDRVMTVDVGARIGLGQTRRLARSESVVVARARAMSSGSSCRRVDDSSQAESGASLPRALRSTGRAAASPT